MKNTAIKTYLLFFFLYSNCIVLADPGSENDTSNLEGSDAPAPIDDYLWLLILLGLVLGFRILKKYQANIDYKK